jgi:predicted adenine nucleotide alpha hydrolase (AANH) superfamily ATPase
MTPKNEGLLLHICCGPCTAGSLPRLREEGLEVTGFFFNPNVHPLMEFKARAEALKDYTVIEGPEIIWEPEYGLVEFVRSVAGNEQNRCEYCYVIRMRKTAREAKRRGYGLFSTTLLYSIHQKHNLLRDVAEQAARDEGVDFLYLDLREEWSSGRQRWRDTGLFSQKYCGCLYSEMERYGNKLQSRSDGLQAEIPEK